MSDKNFKIWGVSYGLIGDLIMGLPVLTYFEKKYPNSYKYWGIEKKCAFMSSLFLNHPLIDRIIISQDWDRFSLKDNYIIDQCQFKCITEGWKHSDPEWYNYRNQVEETSRLAGIFDLKEVLTEEEMKPKLIKWFDLGLQSSHADTGSGGYLDSIDDYKNVISIWPFSTGDRGRQGMRCPSKEWWEIMVDILLNEFRIWHFGLDSEPILSQSRNYIKLTGLSFFDQIKVSLATEMAIATDSGPSWVLSAYDFPTLVLMSNWMHNHKKNLQALLPLGDKVQMEFVENGCDNLKHKDVFDHCEQIIDYLHEVKHESNGSKV